MTGRLIEPQANAVRNRRAARRAILRAAAGASALLFPRFGIAQKKPGKIHRIGMLFHGSPAATAHLNDALMRSMTTLLPSA